MNPIHELQERRQMALALAAAIVTVAEAEDRDLTNDEQIEYNDHLVQSEMLESRIARLQEIESRNAKMAIAPEPVHRMNAPAVLAIPRGDSETRALAHFIRTGDSSGLEYRGSNDTSMNITTGEDGGYAVPVGHFQGIIARRDEMMLANRLAIRRIPGTGTTVDVPVDAEDDGDFVTTSESSDSDRDAPALSEAQMTLVTKTKRIELTNQLLNDEDSNLLAFLNDFIGRGMAKTHNDMLLTEIAANGSNLKTFAGSAAVAAGEFEDIAFADALTYYLDDSNSVGWVMRPSTYGAIAALTGDSRLYAENPGGSRRDATLLGYPVMYSNKAAAIGAGNASVFFGNWFYCGYRESPGLTFLRDPYSRAKQNALVLHYYFRAVYKVLQAEAVGYADHPTA